MLIRLTRSEDVPEEVWAKFKAWMKKRGRTANPYLFPHRFDAGRPLSIDGLKALFKRYAQRAGLSRDFSIHSLRHSIAVMLAARGASSIRIAKWLRHRRVASAEKYFDQVKFSDTGKKLAGIFGDIL